MKLPDIAVESAHLGCWISRQSVLDLIPPMAVNYQRRLRRHHNGDSDDLAQAAALSLLQWEAEFGQQERFRELQILSLLHRSMVAEIRSNRKQSVGGEFDLPELVQLNQKQHDIRTYWLNIAAKAARRPNYEILLLVKGLGWTEAEVQSYFRSKWDDRHFYSIDQIRKFIKDGTRRMQKRVPPDVNTDLLLLSFYT